MYILGLHEGHCASAALGTNGEILAAISEERLTRVKNDFGFPLHSIESLINQLGITKKDISSVVLATNDLGINSMYLKKQATFSQKDFLKEQTDFWYPKLYEGKSIDYLSLFNEKILESKNKHFYDLPFPAQDLNITAQKEIRTNAVKKYVGSHCEILFLDHHLAHASYAAFSLPLPSSPTLVFTIDGFGDGQNATVNILENGVLRRIKSYSNFNIGRIYSFITLLLGMKPQEHEYKLMGMAPYASPSHASEVKKIFQDVIDLEGIEVIYKIPIKDHFFYFKEKLFGHRFDNICGGLQLFTEEFISKWISAWIGKIGISQIALGGGVAMNVKSNMVIGELPQVTKLFIPPSPADETLAIGAIYHYFSKNLEKSNSKISPIKNAYLGHPISPLEVETLIENNISKNSMVSILHKPSNMALADMIADGEIIARVRGNLEFGARALGNRSILANPSNPMTIRDINKAIKKRDFWMPFTPSIHEKFKDRYFKNPKRITENYMTVTFQSTFLARQHLPAAIHPFDGTIRAQVVLESENPDYANLIECFEKITGIGALLNTSFNISGLPMVNSPEQAFNDFMNSGLKHLVLGDYLISKK